MRQQLGFGLQFLALIFLPMIIIWQLNYGFELIYMPMLLLLGFIVFRVGTRMRES